MNKLHTRVNVFRGVKTTKVFELTPEDQKALDKIENLQEMASGMEETYSDDSIRDYLSELWVNVLEECKLVSLKEEKMAWK